MPSDLPEFKKGDHLKNWSPAQLQNLVNAVRKLQNIAVGPGLKLISTASGYRIVLTSEIHKAQPRDATVVLTRLPATDDTMLTVRKIRYATMPPKESATECETVEDGCTYDWDGTDFNAYPDFGLRTRDFEPYYWDPVEIPKLQTAFLKAVFREGYWLVEAPTGAERMCIVRAIPDVDGLFVTVQEVEMDRTGDVWNGEYAIVGEAANVTVWPGTIAADYNLKAWVWRGDWKREATVFPLIRIGGVWYIKQRPKWELVPDDPLMRISDCSLSVERPGIP